MAGGCYQSLDPLRVGPARAKVTSWSEDWYFGFHLARKPHVFP